MTNRSRTPWPLAAIALVLLGGCAAQMQPVADFGAASSHLATVYKPFTAGMATSCEQRERYMALGNAGAYDDAVAERAAGDKCRAAARGRRHRGAVRPGAGATTPTALAKLSGAKADGLRRRHQGPVRRRGQARDARRHADLRQQQAGRRHQDRARRRGPAHRGEDPDAHARHAGRQPGGAAHRRRGDEDLRRQGLRRPARRHARDHGRRTAAASSPRPTRRRRPTSRPACPGATRRRPRAPTSTPTSWRRAACASSTRPPTRWWPRTPT